MKKDMTPQDYSVQQVFSCPKDFLLSTYDDSCEDYVAKTTEFKHPVRFCIQD